MKNKIFFRIDDLGWQEVKFIPVLELFARLGHKLNAEAIPLAVLESIPPGKYQKFKSSLEVHCHGFSHLDHQNAGKKSEFGSQRKAEGVLRDLRRGQEILRTIFGEMYFPIFTPPWNRIDENFAGLLAEAEFRGISRDGDQKFSTKTPRHFKELNISLDLHTRKNGERYSKEEFFADLERNKTSPLGIMLHHKPMVDGDLELLEEILTELNERKISSHFMSELL